MCNVILGAAVGDALGMPFETMKSDNPELMDWDGKTYLPSKYHKLEAGQWTDDSQMTCMVAESLINNSGFDPDDLSKRYVEWFSSGIARGYGRTTAIAINNLIAGKHWTESGVVGSYGNGTAMRAAPFGVFFRNDLYSLVNVLKIDSAITHVSEEAEAGALAIGLMAAHAVNRDMEDILDRIVPHLPDSKVKKTLSSLDAMLSANVSPEQALKVLGTSANVSHTVPSVIYCYLKFDNYIDAATTIIKAGGDTDTNCSIMSALYGAQHGMKFIPSYFYKVEDFDYLIKLDSQLYSRSNKSFFKELIAS